jgi:hypothetical protein
VGEQIAVVQALLGGQAASQPKPEIAPAAQAPASQPKTPAPSANTIFTEDAAAAARARLKAKLGRLQSGIDPETLMDGITLAGYHIEKGARTFAAYARAMVDDLGDGVKPYLQSWYMAVRADPRAADFRAAMDKASAVEDLDIDQVLAATEQVDTTPFTKAVLAKAKAAGQKAAEGIFDWTGKRSTRAEVEVAILDSLIEQFPNGQKGASKVAAKILAEMSNEARSFMTPLDGDGQQDELDAEMRSYEAKGTPPRFASYKGDRQAYLRDRIVWDLGPGRYGERLTAERLAGIEGDPEKQGSTVDEAEIQQALDSLVDDGLVRKSGKSYTLAPADGKPDRFDQAAEKAREAGLPQEQIDAITEQPLFDGEPERAAELLDEAVAAMPEPAAPPTNDPFAGDYAALEGKMIEQTVTTDDGKTATLRMDAAVVMRDFDTREKTLEDLRLCLGRAA